MTEPNQSLQAAERLFDTVQHGDLDQLSDIFADGAQVWHNTDDGLTDIPTTIRNLKTIRESAEIFSYENIRRTATEDGFVQQHTLIVMKPGGPRIEDHACCVCTVKDGRIQRMDAYHASEATGAMAHKSSD